MARWAWIAVGVGAGALGLMALGGARRHRGQLGATGRRGLGVSARGRRTFRVGDLPRDMREELFNEYATSVNPEATERAFYARRVPTGTIAIEGIVVDRYPPDQLLTYDGKLPPIVIADGKLMDGGHRIAAARARGKTHLEYIDVTGLVDTATMGFISELPRGVVEDR